MKKLNYKFWYVSRDDYGFITEAAVRFFEGDYQNIMHKGQQIKDLKRTKRLTHADADFIPARTVRDKGGYEVALYTSANFGMIKTDEELCLFLNNELKKDSTREPCDGQT